MITMCQATGVVLRMTESDSGVRNCILIIEEVFARRFPEVLVTTQQIGPFRALHQAIEAAGIIEELARATSSSEEEQS